MIKKALLVRLIAIAFGLVVLQERPTKESHVRIEIKGRLRVEKPRSKEDTVVANIEGWRIDLTDGKGRQDAAKVENARKLNGEMVIVTGTPYMTIIPDLAIPNQVGNRPQLFKMVVGSSIRRAQ